ncbi:hypothetical protein [Carnobacterium sp. TMP28]|uniref:hypothetical protein n=1 Tax=Carnobacterium sp. TMP28 TaxID=3397060 RepID=UPI0039E0D6E0
MTSDLDLSSLTSLRSISSDVFKTSIFPNVIDTLDRDWMMVVNNTTGFGSFVS